MFYVIVQTVCTIIIAIAAVKYLMPDIRKVCRMIADSGEVKEKKSKIEKEKKDESAAIKKIAEKKVSKPEKKAEKEPDKIEMAESNNTEADMLSENAAIDTADSDCPSEKERGEFPEWEE